MADFLLIDDVPIEIDADTGECDVLEIGDRDRATDGTLLVRVDGTKRIWSVVTREYPLADMETFRTTILTPGEHTINGEMTDSQDVTVDVRVLRYKNVPDGTTIQRMAQLELSEV